MICVYKATIVNLIRPFMQIATYMLWLKGGSSSKIFDFASLNLKVIFRCRDAKLLANAMTSCLGAKTPNTKGFILEGFEFFVSTKRNQVQYGIFIDLTK